MKDATVKVNQEKIRSLCHLHMTKKYIYKYKMALNAVAATTADYRTNDLDTICFYMY